MSEAFIGRGFHRFRDFSGNFFQKSYRLSLENVAGVITFAAALGERVLVREKS